MSIDSEKIKEAVEHGTPFGFVPRRLEITDLPQFYPFPFNVVFMTHAVRDGKQVSGTALYEPDFHTYRKNGSLECMKYHNVYGANSFLVIAYDEVRGSYRGEKFVNGVSVGSANGGLNWHLFFAHLTALGLAVDEGCKFETLEQ